MHLPISPPWSPARAAGHGHASEAVRLLATLAFGRLDPPRAEIRCDTGNAHSRPVAERCGFELEGALRRDPLGVDRAPRDTAVYARLAWDSESKSGMTALALCAGFPLTL